MLILLSPAKTLNTKPWNSPFFTEPLFLNEAEQLNKKLKQLSKKQWQNEMNMSASLAQISYERHQAWKLPFTPENAKVALHTFQGGAYQGLQAEDFTKQELVFAQTHLRLLSGFYGVLRPLDLMQPYRLEMGAAFKMGRCHNLYEFWGEKITQTLNADLEKQSKADALLLNLASNEYFQSIVLETLEVPSITPEFKEKKGNTYKTVGVHAKRARGLMARYLIKNRIVFVEDIKAFNSEGYQYCSELSSATQWVFTRGTTIKQ